MGILMVLFLIAGITVLLTDYNGHKVPLTISVITLATTVFVVGIIQVSAKGNAYGMQSKVDMVVASYDYKHIRPDERDRVLKFAREANASIRTSKYWRNNFFFGAFINSYIGDIEEVDITKVCSSVRWQM